MLKEKQVLEFNYSQARSITRKFNYYDPEGKETIKTHFLFILLKNLPENIPTTPNPRQPDITAKPCKQMFETLETEPEYFTDCNRGLFLMAEKVYFPNTNENDKRVILDFGEDEEGNPKGGLVDGGHTYAVLKKAKKDESLSELPIFITVIEGAESFASKLARARNTSVQVDEKSMANLDKQFQPIKDVLGEYSNKIIYFANEGKGKDSAIFPIEELIALLTALNRGIYDNTNQPTVAYSGTSTCLNKWLNLKNRKTYEMLYPILPSIVEIYEYLYSKFEDYAKEYDGIGSKRFAGVNGIERYRGKGKNKKAVKILLPFTGKQVDYQLSKAFILPVFASLRFLLENKNGAWSWRIQPKEFLDKYGPKLVGQILDAHTKEYSGNPNKTGKSKMLWQNMALLAIAYSGDN